MTTMRILIPRTLISEIEGQVSKGRSSHEAGGIILGLRKGDAIQITKVTTPFPWDKATSMRFERSAFGHRMTALRAWKASQGTVDWVGEWHTHPFGSSNPSYTDRSTWRNLARHTKRPMVFIVAGRSDIFVGCQLVNNRKVICLNNIDSDGEFVLFGNG
jgi:integrative and conjugative element protein (TIGR02256 family)